MSKMSIYEILKEETFQKQEEIKPKLPKLTWKQMATIALCFIIDIGDYFGLAIPYIGDIADIFLILILTKFFGKDAWLANTVQCIEIMPGADFLPLSVIAAMIIMYGEYIKTSKATKSLS